MLLHSTDCALSEKEKLGELNSQLFGNGTGDLFLELAAKIPIENIEHNILPTNLENILHFAIYQAKLAKIIVILENNHFMPFNGKLCLGYYSFNVKYDPSKKAKTLMN